MNQSTDNNLMTAKEVLINNNLDYKVVETPLYDNEGRELDSYKGIMREDTGDMFQVSKKGYQIIQNSESLSLLDEIVNTGMAKYSGATSYKNGAIVQIRCEVPMDYNIVGDEVKNYIHVITSHNGSYATSITGTSQRLICQNILNNRMSAYTRFKHTTNYKLRINEAIEVFAHYRKVFEEQKQAFEVMASKQFNSLQLDSFLNNLLDIDPRDEETSTRKLNMKDQIGELVHVGIGNNRQGVRGTQWALFNSVTEYCTHHRSAGNDSARDFNNLYGGGAKLREKAFDLLTV